ncbi:putative RNA-directed DNA polymerase, eukaryota, reverse transcriptase zinc-binding domain protein [Tanacetum coccineum]|uniref:RNA-directed DNA polymerase, eukaryota, reverse transcriptase zinc-binding domain protein n=1 Tax=Tanacetum coccineum TaxID=301880 RepID=A0ABQ4XJR5_9ASTR
MMFKVNFENAYDTVSWKFLDHMLSGLGFGSKWRRWIQLCLQTSRSHVLVNGSPSAEFLISRGLRQGDPLSQFLFLIIMEGLNIALKDPVGSGFIHGTQVFYLASGLKINISKSNVYEIGVSSEEIEDMARATGCASESCLLGRQICCLLEGVSLYIKQYSGASGGSGDNKKMSWIKWENILASHDKGVLGIGSLKAFNLALLQKWRWRLVTISDSLWARVVKVIHGVDTGMELKGYNSSGNGPLSTRYNRLFHLDANPNCMLANRVSDDTWTWNWKRQRLGSRNEESLEILKTKIVHVQVNDCPDSWHWNAADDGVFSVNVTRLHVDDCIFPSLSLKVVKLNVGILGYLILCNPLLAPG